MEVICTNNKNGYNDCKFSDASKDLTMYKSYEVIEKKNTMVLIKCNDGKEKLYYMSRFRYKTIEEIREDNLNKLL